MIYVLLDQSCPFGTQYPDVFGGTWPTAPDPVDFHAFIPVDLTSERNIYRKVDGSKRMVMRVESKEIAMEAYARREFVLGEYGGQLSSFEAVFSPRGADGRPLRLFNRVTGEIDPQVAKAWEKYDIADLLRHNWGELGPKLNGKIHLYVGMTINTSTNPRGYCSGPFEPWVAKQILCFFRTARMRMSMMTEWRSRFGRRFGIQRGPPHTIRPKRSSSP